MNETEPLDLVTLPQYQQQRAQVFPSLDSLRWFVRQHGAELAARGALLQPARRLLVSPQRFDECMREVGARKVGQDSRRA